jgi:hypothetical protein
VDTGCFRFTSKRQRCNVAFAADTRETDLPRTSNRFTLLDDRIDGQDGPFPDDQIITESPPLVVEDGNDIDESRLRGSTERRNFRRPSRRGRVRGRGRRGISNTEIGSEMNDDATCLEENFRERRIHEQNGGLAGDIPLNVESNVGSRRGSKRGRGNTRSRSRRSSSRGRNRSFGNVSQSGSNHSSSQGNVSSQDDIGRLNAWPYIIDEDCTNRRIAGYMQANSDETLSRSVCCVCGGRVFLKKKMKKIGFEHFCNYFLATLHRQTIVLEKKPNGMSWNAYRDDPEYAPTIESFNPSD